MLLFSACSLHTPYKKEGTGIAGGGYTDQKIDANRWHILLGGNGYTNEQTLMQYFYRRANEIVQENGFDGYVLEEVQSKSKKGAFNKYYPSVWGTIKCYKGQRPDS